MSTQRVLFELSGNHRAVSRVVRRILDDAGLDGVAFGLAEDPSRSPDGHDPSYDGRSCSCSCGWIAVAGAGDGDDQVAFHVASMRLPVGPTKSVDAIDDDASRRLADALRKVVRPEAWILADALDRDRRNRRAHRDDRVHRDLDRSSLSEFVSAWPFPFPDLEFSHDMARVIVARLLLTGRKTSVGES